MDVFSCHGSMEHNFGLDIMPSLRYVTLKAPVITAADDIHKYFSLFFRENKT